VYDRFDPPQTKPTLPPPPPPPSKTNISTEQLSKSNRIESKSPSPQRIKVKDFISKKSFSKKIFPGSSKNS
jgi:hypothetical protein